MYICPYCGHDRNTSENFTPELQELLRENKITLEAVNPGGRELRFQSGGRVQLSDQCNYCDYQKLYNFLKKEKEG